MPRVSERHTAEVVIVKEKGPEQDARVPRMSRQSMFHHRYIDFTSPQLLRSSATASSFHDGTASQMASSTMNDHASN